MISDRVAPPDPVAAPAPASVAPAAPQIEYAKTSGGVSRRQMNLLLLFIVIDTLLFAAFVCLPTASPYLKSMWADYQKRREDQRHAAVVQAKLNACLAHTAPADQALYIEEPVGANRLLAADAAAVLLPRELGSRRSDGVTLDSMANTALRASAWQPPARAETAAEVLAWRNVLPTPYPAIGEGETTLFLHQMKTPSGGQRLVIISFAATQYITDLEPKKAPHRHYEVETIRTFKATVLDPQRPGLDASQTRMVVNDPAAARTQLLAVFAAGDDPHPVVDLRTVGRWRIFAGQADPADPTHLTIGYEIDGQAAVMDGWLNDGDRLMLTPRVGRMVAWTSGFEYEWDLTAGAPQPPAIPWLTAPGPASRRSP
jgi:hypothetical protein